MNRALGFFPLFVIGLFALGCGAADPSEPATGEIDSVQQATIAPIEEPGPAIPCVESCLRVDPTGMLAGVCCICQGEAKQFAPSPIRPYLYICR